MPGSGSPVLNSKPKGGPSDPGPFTVEELPDTAERDLGLTHMICGPCQIPEEQGEPVAVAFTFSADDAVLFASVLDLLTQLENAEEVIRHIRLRTTWEDAVLAWVQAAIAKARKATP